jgi:hypothetical protein
VIHGLSPPRREAARRQEPQISDSRQSQRWNSGSQLARASDASAHNRVIGTCRSNDEPDAASRGVGDPYPSHAAFYVTIRIRPSFRPLEKYPPPLCVAAGFLTLHGWAEQIRAICMRKRRPSARLDRAHDVWGHGKVTITLARAASFQRAGDAGQLRRDPLRRVSRQLVFEEALPASLLQDCG